MRVTLSPYTPMWLEASPNQALILGALSVERLFMTLTICVYVFNCVYVSPPAMLEGFHCLQELLQVKFVFLTFY